MTPNPHQLRLQEEGCSVSTGDWNPTVDDNGAPLPDVTTAAHACYRCGTVFESSQEVWRHECPAGTAAEAAPAVKRKASHVGAPAIFALESACQDLERAFGGFGCYLVGSAIERPDWRDVDVRLIMADDEFEALFPGAGPVAHARWEFDPRWLWLTVSISARLSHLTGLPIDFQFQPQTHANARHKGPRHALGMYVAPEQSA